MPDVILHIGFNKCGSTAIQRWLADTREDLLRHGFFYQRTDPRPEQICSNPHVPLLAYDLAGQVSSTHRVLKVLGVDPDAQDALAQQHRIAQAFRQKVESQSAERPDQRFVFSSEHLTKRSLTNPLIGPLVDWLSRVFDRVHAIAYVRRPQSWVVSRHDHEARRRGVAEPLSDFARRVPHTHYARMLGLWEAAIGRTNMDVRLFRESWLGGTGLIEDFADALGYAGPGAAERPPLVNTRFAKRGGLRGLLPARLSRQVARPVLDPDTSAHIAQANAADMDWIENTYFATERDRYRAWLHETS